MAWIVTLAVVSLAQAGDEDMSPSAYHVFDPETGYMMTIDPQAEEQIGVQEAALEDARKNAENARGDATTDTGVSGSWIYLAGIAVLIIGIVAVTALQRRAKR